MNRESPPMVWLKCVDCGLHAYRRSPAYLCLPCRRARKARYMRRWHLAHPERKHTTEYSREWKRRHQLQKPPIRCSTCKRKMLRIPGRHEKNVHCRPCRRLRKQYHDNLVGKLARRKLAA